MAQPGQIDPVPVPRETDVVVVLNPHPEDLVVPLLGHDLYGVLVVAHDIGPGGIIGDVVRVGTVEGHPTAIGSLPVANEVATHDGLLVLVLLRLPLLLCLSPALDNHIGRRATQLDDRLLALPQLQRVAVDRVHVEGHVARLVRDGDAAVDGLTVAE